MGKTPRPGEASGAGRSPSVFPPHPRKGQSPSRVKCVGLVGEERGPQPLPGPHETYGLSGPVGGRGGSVGGGRGGRAEHTRRKDAGEASAENAPPRPRQSRTGDVADPLHPTMKISWSFRVQLRSCLSQEATSLHPHFSETELPLTCVWHTDTPRNPEGSPTGPSPPSLSCFFFLVFQPPSLPTPSRSSHFALPLPAQPELTALLHASCHPQSSGVSHQSLRLCSPRRVNAGSTAPPMSAAGHVFGTVGPCGGGRTLGSLIAVHNVLFPKISNHPRPISNCKRSFPAQIHQRFS